MSEKINANFINRNKNLIIKESIVNARRLRDVSKILMENGQYAAAHPRVIEALEELAKASLLKRGDDFGALEGVVRHDKKAEEIIKILARHYRVPVSENRISWGKKRIPQMREDATYVRLKPTSDNRIGPDNKYWRKRSKSFYKLLSDILDRLP